MQRSKSAFFTSRLEKPARRPTKQTPKGRRAAWKSTRNSYQISDLSVAVRPPKYVPHYYDWEPSRDKKIIPDQIPMRFEKGITIGGQIQDSSGRPISGATVEVTIPANTGNMHFHVGTLKSDQQGRWRCDGCRGVVPRVVACRASRFHAGPCGADSGAERAEQAAWNAEFCSTGRCGTQKTSPSVASVSAWGGLGDSRTSRRPRPMCKGSSY